MNSCPLLAEITSLEIAVSKNSSSDLMSLVTKSVIWVMVKGFWLEPWGSKAFLSGVRGKRSTFVLRDKALSGGNGLFDGIVNSRFRNIQEINFQFRLEGFRLVFEIGKHFVKVGQSQELILRGIDPINQFLGNGGQSAVCFGNCFVKGSGFHYQHGEHCTETCS